MAWLSTTVLGDDWLGISGATTLNTILSAAIAQAESEIESYIHQPVATTTKDIYFSGNRSNTYMLPITSGATLTSLLARDFPYESFATLTGTPVAYQRDGVWYLYYDSGFIQNEYKATLTVGFATIPQDFIVSGYELAKEICLEMQKSSQGVDRFGISATTESEGGVSLSKALLQQREKMKQRLYGYRVIEI